MEGWAAARGRAKHTAAIAQLRRLQLLQEAGAGGGRPGWRLHPAFRRQLCGAVTGRCEFVLAAAFAVVPMLLLQGLCCDIAHLCRALCTILQFLP